MEKSQKYQIPDASNLFHSSVRKYLTYSPAAYFLKMPATFFWGTTQLRINRTFTTVLVEELPYDPIFSSQYQGNYIITLDIPEQDQSLSIK